MAATKLCARTILSEHEDYVTPAGSRTTPEYGYEVNKKGQKQLVITGQKNTWEEIQSYKEDCLIENILKRLAVGDMTDFRPDGIYADTTQIPTNMIDAQKQIVMLENTWKKLPIEVREKYDHSLETFISKAGEKSWMLDMGLIQPEKPEEPINVKTTAPETTVETPKTE